MLSTEHIFAKRYAQAFLNSLKEPLTPGQFEALCSARDYMQEHHHALSTLRIGMIDKQRKVDLLSHIFTSFEVAPLMLPLVQLLVDHKRSYLIVRVMRAIVQEYEKRNNIVFFRIMSTPMLNSEQLQVVTKFLAQETGKKIMYKAMEEPRLIAGIRAQSPSYLWEYSVSLQLQRCRKVVMR